MNEKLKVNLLANYPEWHDNPLRLTIPEMEDPFLVLDSFFSCYDLPGIRACLQELLYDSLRADDISPSDHVNTHHDIEKLVEAAWIVFNQHKNKKVNHDMKEPKESKLTVSSGYPFEDPEGCYAVINDFFQSFTLLQARKYLLTSLKAAESKKVWKQGNAPDLLWFFEVLENLLKSVLLISTKDYTNEIAIIKGSQWYTPDITQYHQYCGIYNRAMAWDYIPRALSIKEYHDPYKALGKITNYFDKSEWKDQIKDIMSYALGPNSLSELGVDIELLQVHQLLQKMVEASHLIYVRMNFKPIETISEK